MNNCVITKNIGEGFEYDFTATSIRGAKRILKREFTKNTDASFTIGFVNNTEKEVKEYEGKALSYQVLADWASHGLGSAILPRSKLLPHTPKQQIFKASKPAKIVFEAKWLSKDNKSLEKMLQHFRNNINEIAKGIAD